MHRKVLRFHKLIEEIYMSIEMTCARTRPYRDQFNGPLTFDRFVNNIHHFIHNGQRDTLEEYVYKNKNIFRKDLENCKALPLLLEPYLSDTLTTTEDLNNSLFLVSLIHEELDSPIWCQIALAMIAFEKNERQGIDLVREMVLSDQQPWNPNFRSNLIEIGKQCDRRDCLNLKEKVQNLLNRYNLLVLALPIPTSDHRFNVRSPYLFV